MKASRRVYDCQLGSPYDGFRPIAGEPSVYPIYTTHRWPSPRCCTLPKYFGYLWTEKTAKASGLRLPPCGFPAHAAQNAVINILRRHTASMRMEEPQVQRRANWKEVRPPPENPRHSRRRTRFARSKRCELDAAAIDRRPPPTGVAHSQLRYRDCTDSPGCPALPGA
jgi:hypothetical protein